LQRRPLHFYLPTKNPTSAPDGNVGIRSQGVDVSEDKSIREVPPSELADLEERAIDPGTAAAVVSATASVVAAGVQVKQAIQSSKTSEPPPPTPSRIELPPGVDRD
jgi:hypothetical protein